jgi:dolichyl-phosphate-mannose-protein mannosyltransferase
MFSLFSCHLQMELFVHMAYRGIYLLGIPLLMNIALFYLHFLILTNSGPGNAFVSLPFQNTLEGDTVPPPVKYTVPDNSTLLRYSSQISFRSQDFSCWLHSHKDLYPLKYPDGRGSSYQQQVTCYEFQDKNNFWAIRRPGDPSDATITNDTDPVRNKDIIELVHVSTNKLLNSHDVAAPLSPANQEIAGYINYSTKFVPYLHWRIELQGVSENIPIFWAPKKTKFRLIHINSGQAIGCTGKRLPEWGFQQYEVATDRAVESSHTSWIMDDANNPTSTDDMLEEEEMLRNSTMNQYTPVIQSQPPQDSNVSYSFWEKYFEMQGRMLAAHGNLGDHQFGAPPTQWPLLGKTLPYWLDNKTNAQMTLIGNPILWWMASASIALFFGILLVYLLRKRRNINDIPEDVYQQYWTSGLVLIVGWAAHYLPYFLLSRVLFLHHYLPALPFKFMLLAAMCEHGFLWSSKIKWRPLLMIRLYKGLIFVICLAVFSCFLLFAPFTFGYPSLTKSQIMWLRWRSHWDLLMRN